MRIRRLVHRRCARCSRPRARPCRRRSPARSASTASSTCWCPSRRSRRAPQVAYRPGAEQGASTSGALNTDQQTYQRVQNDLAPADPADRHVSPGRAAVELGSERADDRRRERVLHARRQDHGLHRPDRAAARDRCGARRRDRPRDRARACASIRANALSRAYAEQLVLAGIAVATGASEATMQLASQVSAVTFHVAAQSRAGSRSGSHRPGAHGARRLRPERRGHAVAEDGEARAAAARRNSSARILRASRASAICEAPCRACCRCIRRRRSKESG